MLRWIYDIYDWSSYMHWVSPGSSAVTIWCPLLSTHCSQQMSPSISPYHSQGFSGGLQKSPPRGVSRETAHLFCAVLYMYFKSWVKHTSGARTEIIAILNLGCKRACLAKDTKFFFTDVQHAL